VACLSRRHSRRWPRIYRLDRTGGVRSPRFVAYLARVESEHALAPYNPMAGPAALASVQRLIELDAEAIAGRHAAEAELAVVVSSPGLWTDRVATEVELRTDPEPPALVRFWAGEPVEAADVERECAAAVQRVHWSLEHGPARTVDAVLAREGRGVCGRRQPVRAARSRRSRTRRGGGRVARCERATRRYRSRPVRRPGGGGARVDAARAAVACRVPLGHRAGAWRSVDGRSHALRADRPLGALGDDRRSGAERARRSAGRDTNGAVHYLDGPRGRSRATC